MVAVGDAIIKETGWSDSFGYYIKYSLKDKNYLVKYAHLDKILVSENQEIKKGEVIALSGNTGFSTGPHLHYTLWKGDELINPLYFVNLPHTQEVSEELKKRGEVF